MSAIFSTTDQLARIGLILSRYIRLPVSTDAIPGAFLEAVLAHVRGGRVLPTKDFIDVVSPDHRVGWSIKSTKAGSPLTWMRATFSDRDDRIALARTSVEQRQALGTSILGLINHHARASIARYGLTEIGYARLVVQASGRILYFERSLCTQERPMVFDPDEFTWSWSSQAHEGGASKSLHGTHVPTGGKWWSWFPGQNQLHFNGDRYWWPNDGDPNAIRFSLPTDAEKLSFDWLVDKLEMS